MPVAPATIVRTKRSWPGHVDDAQRAGPRAARARANPSSIEMPRARSSRQPVGVDAGQRLDQHGLAVVDVARRAERQRQRLGGACGLAERLGDAASPRTSTSSSEIVRGSSRTALVPHPRHHRRISRAQPGAAAASTLAACRCTATTGPSSSSSGSEPPPARPVARDHPRPPRRRHALRRAPRDRRSARASSSASVAASILQHRDLARRTRRVAVQPQRRLERRERELVDPHRARQRMRRAAARSPPRVPTTMPGLRAARAACRRRSRRRRRPRRRCAAPTGSSRQQRAERVVAPRQHAGAEVVDHRRRRARAAERAELARSRPPR